MNLIFLDTPFPWIDYGSLCSIQTTELALTAPENGTLNISPSMPQLPELVDYSSKGGGNIRVKCKGVKAITNVKTEQSSLTVDEITIEYHPYNLVDRIQDSCREND